MTSPEQGKRIVVTEADLAEAQDVVVTHEELPVVGEKRQLPPITTEQKLAGITLRDPEA